MTILQSVILSGSEESKLVFVRENKARPGEEFCHASCREATLLFVNS